MSDQYRGGGRGGGQHQHRGGGGGYRGRGRGRGGFQQKEYYQVSQPPRHGQNQQQQSYQQQQQQQQHHHKRSAPQSDDQKNKKRRTGGAFTIDTILSDTLTPIAAQYWTAGSPTLSPYNPEIIEQIYREHIHPHKVQEAGEVSIGAAAHAESGRTIQQRIAVLELSSYLENYLWKYFDPVTSTHAHIMSILTLINAKFRENLIGIWEPFHAKKELFAQFIDRVLRMKLDSTLDAKLSIHERLTYLIFLIHAFASLEDDTVRTALLKLTSLPLWLSLSPSTLRTQLRNFPELKPKLTKLQSQIASNPSKYELSQHFLPQMFREFFRILETLNEESDYKSKDVRASLRYVERFLEFLIDLLSQLPTRRFFHALVEEIHFIVCCELSSLYSLTTRVVKNNKTEKKEGEDEDGEVSDDDEEDEIIVKPENEKTTTGPGKLFTQLVEHLRYYMAFEIDDQSGTPLSEDELLATHYAQLEHLQRISFAHFPQLKPLAMAPISNVDQREKLIEYLEPLDDETLRELCAKLHLLPEESAAATSLVPVSYRQSRQFLATIIIEHYQRRISQKQQVREMPLFPIETLLFDPHQVPSQNYTGEGCLALPKLNLQFLTFHDYLLRNFNLFRLESTYQIREDIAMTIKRLRPRLSATGTDTVFTGWARFAIPIYKFAITRVEKPLLGFIKPARVRAEVTVDLAPFQQQVRQEWYEIREHDVFFLITVRATIPMHVQVDESEMVDVDLDDVDFTGDHSWERLHIRSLGIQYVRGCTVRAVTDETGTVIGSRDEHGNLYRPVGTERTYRIELDEAQYAMDMAAMIDEPDREDVYTTFNLLMRRKPEENNFKAVLQTIRDLMETDIKVPSWLHDVFLGYGDPSAAAYYNLPSQLPTIKFIDTFINDYHLRSSFPNPIEFIDEDPSIQHPQLLKPAYELQVPKGMPPNHEKLQKMLELQLPQTSTSTEMGAQVATVATTTTTATHLTTTVQGQNTAPVKPTEPAAPTFPTLTEPTRPIEPTAPSKVAKPTSSSTPSVDVSTLPSLTVVVLKDMLKQRNQPTNGVKAQLVERLTSYIQEHENNKMETDEISTEDDAKYKEAMEIYQKELTKYEADMKTYQDAKTQQEQQQQAYEKAKATYQEELKKYEAALAQHKAGESAMEVDGATTTTPAPAPVPTPTSSSTTTTPISTVDPSLPPIRVSRIARIAARDDLVKCNEVSFTPVQVEAIKSGLNPGLTMIVGPPGTGKTDTAVQIVSELYHNFPTQRTLLVTHSNQALNDLFEKIMQRDIDERYLLRQGRGQEYLESDKDFSKFGRVNFMLTRRLQLLDEVSSIGTSLDMPSGVAYTCENAQHFFLQHILARWEKFNLTIQQQLTALESKPVSETQTIRDTLISTHFPFTKYFQERAQRQAEHYGMTYQPIFINKYEQDSLTAKSCYADLEKKFQELEECRPFELLRTYKDRGNYLLTKHAKIIAMTCTHAAIRRGEMVKLDFQFDNIVMEEAAQILEIETFIPMLLQNDDKEFGSRLKRVILLGDHHQLPPVIKNRAFQKYSHMDQSLFTRFVRLGVPVIQLNAQGRSRPSLASLWNWRYQNLTNLPAVKTLPQYVVANPGFVHEFQFIDVQDYQGAGETTPTAYFYQNLGEAEYAVATYMYMRLLGYPASSISIITSYNGQRALISDVLEQRCARNPIFGMPAKVTTVDKFQGQQNDYILLSLVRTRTAGHIRDIRRLVVAMSRARLGLYVFGRQSLFANCYELTRTFNILATKPTKLQLIPMERIQPDGSTPFRLPGIAPPPPALVEVNDVIQMGALVHQMTAALQAEHTEYQRRIHEYERAEYEKRQTLARREEQHRQAQARMEEEELKIQQQEQITAQAENKAEAVANAARRAQVLEASATTASANEEEESADEAGGDADSEED